MNCRTKAKELGFSDLKFVGAEFSYDGSHLTLMYNSEEGGEKPDLRSLRRAMSRFYPHSQIEMHPMGPRDVAKLLGGMGACGLEERCCTAYLTDFSPISIKMAKEQGISLTPTEITGMCGRLRCCLAYEYEQYTEARKTLPKKNKRVLTPHGEGKVLEVLPLKGAVLVILDTEVLHEYLAHDIQLFDENGTLLPRAAAPAVEEPVEETKPYLLEALEPPEPVLAAEKGTGSEKPFKPVNQADTQQPSRGKGDQGDPRRVQHPGPQGQKGFPGQSAPKKHKPGSRPGSKPGDNTQVTGNRQQKGKPPSNQRRNRGRQR
jgi:cell fate regulator YaaT (PSP1 superfamily)